MPVLIRQVLWSPRIRELLDGFACHHPTASSGANVAGFHTEQAPSDLSELEQRKVFASWQARGYAGRWRLLEHDKTSMVIMTYICAFIIQSRSSSPSSGPPGPPRTWRNSRGRHSKPSPARLLASSRWRSSIFPFSFVANSWSLDTIACTVVCHSLCDSRSLCSSRGRDRGGECFAFVASNKSSL